MSQTPDLFSLSDVFEEGASCNDDVQDAGDSEVLLPISFRVTAEEKARIRRAAGKRSISSYVRDCVLGDDAPTSDKRRRKNARPQQPKLEAMEVARLLGTFGQSEIATHILALSLAVQSGELPVSDEVESKLERACDDIAQMKLALVMALGMKPRTASGA